MQFERLLDQVIKDEGFRADPYQDTLGVWTIGFGSTYIGVDKVTSKTPPVSYQAAMNLLMSSVYGACIDAQGLFQGFDHLDDVRQEVLVNMAYNLGGTGLGRFKKLKIALLDMDFARAAMEMEDSRWFNQVGARAKRLINEMLSGKK